MNPENIVSLIKKYQEGKCTPEEEEVLLYWFNAIQFGQGSGSERTPDLPAKERMWEAIHKHRKASEERLKLPVSRWWQSRWMRVAYAGILVLFAAGMYFFDEVLPQTAPSEASTPAIAKGWQSVENDGLAACAVLLNDGSKVTLKPGARLSHPALFDPEVRMVRLEGDGTFDVSSNPRQPFFVYSGGICTKVLGTSFTITNGNDGSIEVAVHSGRVLVEKAGGRGRSPGNSLNEVLLTPNKKVVFFEADESFVLGLVDKPQLLRNPGNLYTTTDAFDFDEVLLGDVLKRIENAYGVEIHLENPYAADCPVTANLNDDNMYDKLDVIAAILNFSLEIQGDQIYLKGDGCKNGVRPDLP